MKTTSFNISRRILNGSFFILLLSFISCQTEPTERTPIDVIENTTDNRVVKEGDVYLKGIDKMPSFADGEDQLFYYIQSNIHYPETEKAAGTEGTVYYTFVINESGNVMDVEVLKGVSDELDQEGKRVLETMPAWIPGEHEGVPVKVRFNLPVKFSL